MHCEGPQLSAIRCILKRIRPAHLKGDSVQILGLDPLDFIILLLLVEGLPPELCYSLCFGLAEGLDLLGPSIPLLTEDGQHLVVAEEASADVDGLAREARED